MWQIYFTGHFVETYAERLQFVDSGALDETTQSGRLFTNDSLARELGRAGNFYVAERERFYCLINGLKAYIVELRLPSEKCIVVTALSLQSGLLAKIRNSERVNVPNLGRQNPNARMIGLEDCVPAA
ncbi:MAG: hypothetical protein HYT16_03525 [DPANN group archaeon]|nr:hypothetical protein [DPANN group archaeon]